MTRDRDVGSPEQAGNKPFPRLEKLFSTKDTAQVVVFESGGDAYGEPRIDIDRLVDRYAGIFGRRRLPRRRTPVYGLDDLIEQHNAITAEHAKPGDSYIMEDVRKNEARFMARILLSPSKDPEQVRQRQELIGRLAASEHLDDLIELKDSTWQVFEGLNIFKLD